MGTIEDGKPKQGKRRAHFPGYTFKRNLEQEKSPLVSALEELENIKPSAVRAPGFEKVSKLNKKLEIKIVVSIAGIKNGSIYRSCIQLSIILKISIPKTWYKSPSKVENTSSSLSNMVPAVSSNKAKGWISLQQILVN